MRKMIIFAALALLAPSVKAEELLLPGLPGMKMDVSAPAGEAEISRPDAQKVLADLSAELRLSAKQEERITAAVDKKGKDFDKLLKEYDKASAEEKKWRYQVNELKYEMARINKDMPDAIRDFLDDDQRQTYDAMLAAKNKPAAAPETRIEAAPAVEPVAEAPKPARKRKLIKRKKPKAAGEASDALSPAAPPAAAGAVEEEPGQVMVDRDPASAQAAAGSRKKRALKKKAAVQEPAPVDDIMANEPAGAKPTGKEVPADAAEDAGSYP